MAEKQLGSAPTVSDDTATVGYLIGMLPGHSSYITIDDDYTIALPDDPKDHQMELFEIYASAPATVTYPEGTLLVAGITFSVDIDVGKTGFFGFRYSANASAWFLLSAATQAT